MAYSDFTLDDLELKFGIKNQIESVFVDFRKIEPSKKLQEALQTATELPVRSEKAKSELIVMPILIELRAINNKFFTIYSGDQLNADKETGLVGECDFILTKDTGTFNINYPILQIVEAKKHDIEIGIPQCMAQLLGAKIFNETKKRPLSRIYGCVTTGDDWLFMFLENNTVYIDNKRYYLSEVEKILGVFQTIIDFYKKELK